MQNFNTAEQAVKAALANHAALRVCYRNNQGKESVRVIEPLRWDNNYVFIAYCHLRQEERSFKTSNIVEFQYFDTVEQALEHERNPSRAVPPAAAAPQQAPRPPAPTAPTMRFQAVARTLPQAQASKPTQEQIDQVTSAEKWSRLVKYYSGCLEQENRQAYLLKPDDCQLLEASVADLHQLMQSRMSLEIARGSRLAASPAAAFIEKNFKNAMYRLCVGYPFFVTSQNEIAPLIYSPLNVSEEAQAYRLTADSFELSYAALNALQLSEDEINAFTAEVERAAPANSPEGIQLAQQLLMNRLAQITGTALPVYSDAPRPGAMYTCPMLFWVKSSIATMNLIQELKELSDAARWPTVPQALRQLLTGQPAHALPDPPAPAEDNSLYVTPAYEQQTRAALAARTEPVLVVTGPPGTGKSQLVLNILAQAFMKGETALFASRNNQAVDVVMNRLRSELKFQGAIRTGSQENRLKAAQQMKQALGQISSRTDPSRLEGLQRDYQAARADLRLAQSRLQEVKNLLGLSRSYQQEKQQTAGRLPPGLWHSLDQSVPPFQQVEWELLQAAILSLIEQTLAIQQDKAGIEKQAAQIQSGGSALITGILHFEDQWGAFGGGFLQNQALDGMTHLAGHLATWLDFLDFIEIHAAWCSLLAQKADQEKKVLESKARLAPELLEKIPPYVEKLNRDDLKRHALSFSRLASSYQKLAGRRSLLDRLLSLVGLHDSASRNLSRLAELQRLSGLPESPWEEVRGLEPENLARVCSGASWFLIAGRDCSDLAVLENQVRDSEAGLRVQRGKIPAALAADFEKLPPLPADLPALRAQFQTLLGKWTALQSRLARGIEQVHASLAQNVNSLSMLTAFRASPAGREPTPWALSAQDGPDAVLAYLSLWRSLASYWKAAASLQQVTYRLTQLPGEAEAAQSVRQYNDRLMALSGDILRQTWNERAHRIPNLVMQQASTYAAAVEELSRPAYDSASYSQHKADEKNNLSAAVKLFPVWATTNLSARTNFPLEDGYFDLVIIDEASQCDMPSALPLLYRAKRVIIIGDPNQLKHVATLTEKNNQDLAAKYGISLGSFSYSANSLFDIAQRSAGTQPGTLLLNEHFRSDARVIGFSNQEFYDNRLQIKTDLSLRGIDKSFLNANGGIFWVNVAGQAERPSTGSAFNQDEEQCVAEMLPAFRAFLQGARLDGSSIGVVTPYRLQEEHITRKIANPAITVGTAHKFQGDERDFMIFSAVAAVGLVPGSVKWLQDQRNLLNVAVTRARIGLIVVGDHAYCLALPPDHCFRRLANYVQHEPGRVVRSFNELPFFSKAPAPPLIGALLDPHNPEYNRTTLQRFLSACREFVWWTDPYFNDHVMDLFWDVFQDAGCSLKQVQLLTAVEQINANNGSKPKLDGEVLHLLAAELERRGVHFELRVLPRKELPHDRLLYHPGDAVNMPPFAGAYGDHNHVSEYTRSSTDREFFDRYWQKASKA